MVDRMVFKRSMRQTPHLMVTGAVTVVLLLLAAPISGGDADHEAEEAGSVESPQPGIPGEGVGDVEGGETSPRQAAAAPAAPTDWDPDRSCGGFDIWVAHQDDDGSWSVPVNLGPPVNTHLRENSPTLSRDGQALFFASRGRPDGNGRTDLFVSRRQAEGWGPPENLGPGVNSGLDELGPCPLPDSNRLLFCRYDPRQKSYDLLLTLNIEGVWLEAIGIGKPIATPAEERLPSVTADGEVLFFAARWRGGRGNFDIFQSYRDDHGNWSEPVNLGPRINTSAPEYSPGISPDGNRLYFASMREGRDSWDIYVSERREGGTWEEAYPLPAPVNTERYAEYCPSVAADGRTLYFASDRQHGRVIAFVEEE